MIRLAAVQCPSILDNASDACDAIEQRLRWADEQAVDLVIFPEAFLLGHSYDADDRIADERNSERFSEKEIVITGGRPFVRLIVHCASAERLRP